MNESKVKKESLWKKGIKFVCKIPKILKLVLIICLILFIYFGFVVSTNFSMNSKATKFGLTDMGELITQTSYVTIVQDSKEDLDFFDLFKIPFTTSRMIFSYDFTVDASVNFEEISYKIDDSKKEIIVDLPHAKHYKTTMIIDSQVVYLDEESLFSRIDLKEQNKALQEMETKATATALENNLLEAADKNAQRIIGAMLKSDSKRSNYIIFYNYID